jgi:hypothetical protein
VDFIATTLRAAETDHGPILFGMWMSASTAA